MLKIVILQFIYDRSDRQIEDDLRYHMAIKFFVGLEVDELGPDNATISRFRSRLGPERFAGLFNNIVEGARTAGFISDRLHAVDATAVAAKVDMWRRRGEDEEGEDGDTQAGSDGGLVKWEGPRLSRGPDTDAAFGYKGKDKPFHG